MLLESFALQSLSDKIKDLHDKEHMNGWDAEAVLTVIGVSLWFILWIFAVVHAINCAKQKPKLKNVQAGIILSAISWPFYVVFYLTGAICYR